MQYDPNPCYAAVGGVVATGWAGPVAELPEPPMVLALDGPWLLDWEGAIAGLTELLEARTRNPVPVDLREWFVPWPQLVLATGSPALADDPDFDRLAGGRLADLLRALPPVRAPDDGTLVAYGPGAALLPHDRLWYLDLPKRYAEAEVTAGRGRNLGQGPGDGSATTKRLFYIDWPLQDRHREAIAGGIDRWVDVQDPGQPTSVDGDTLRRTIDDLARRPLRTRPTFNTTPWGGHWAQRRLGVNLDALNTALGYELIAPESSVLIGAPGAAVEVPLQLIAAAHPVELMGRAVHEMFGTSFPIRFDYLDTVDGGNLSVHCHPRPEDMLEVFGWPYPQHETYYLMVGGRGHRVFLGLRRERDLSEFRRAAEEADSGGAPMEIERYVQVFPAVPHQLFCIPAGTPHGSGVGNVVLEISATPYLYSLRFYDWLRRDHAGRQRPVHVGHAFRNLDNRRTGRDVRAELIQSPIILRTGDGWHEEVIGSLPEMFFDVRRVVLLSDSAVDDDTAGRFHILNVVEGDGVAVEPVIGTAHDLAYAETLVVPAAVGAYRLRRLADRPVRVVKALVR